MNSAQTSAQRAARERAPGSSRLAKAGKWATLTLGALATGSGVLALFGIQGSPWIGGGLVFAGLVIVLAVLVVALRIENRRLKGVIVNNDASEIVENIHQGIQLLSASPDDNEVHVLGSGTETYYGILSHLLDRGRLRRGTVVHLGYRLGGDKKRQAKLAEYAGKWQDLAKRFDLKIQYYPFPEYVVFLRGIVVQRRQGCIGFYHRPRNTTVGVGERCIFVTPAGAFGPYLVSAFLKCFDVVPSEASMRIVRTLAAGREA